MIAIRVQRVGSPNPYGSNNPLVLGFAVRSTQPTKITQITHEMKGPQLES